MPKLSVIVPVYNTEKYLRECVDSILHQTFTDFELILVDDGSTDGSGTICDAYAEQDPRVRVIHQKNAGVTRARKNGVCLSQGEHVAFVDSDDWIDLDCYSNMMLQVEKYNTDIAAFAIIQEKKLCVNGVGLGYFSREKLTQNVHPKMLFDYSSNSSGMIASLCNKIIRRDILLNAITAIPDELDYGEDAISSYLCALNASSAYICNQPFYHYRNNPCSSSHVSSFVMKKRILALDREMRHQFSGFDIDMSSQIDGHITRHTVELVRSVLICRNERPFLDRCRDMRNFCEELQIASALDGAYPYICKTKEKVKVMLIKCGMFGLLYILFRKV